MDRMKYRPWRFERPADNQDICKKDPQPSMAAGSRYKRPSGGASAIARAGYESIDLAERGSDSRPVGYPID